MRKYFCSLIILFSTNFLISENHSSISNYFINPKPGSHFAMPGHTITIRSGAELFDVGLIKFQVSGSRSGIVECEPKIASDGKSLLLLPNKEFQFGETVTVSIQNFPDPENGKKNLQFDFTVLNQMPKYEKKILNNLSQLTTYDSKNNLPGHLLEIPEGVPPITVKRYEGEGFGDLKPGYYFIAPFELPVEQDFFPNFKAIPTLMIVDETGLPIYYKRSPQDEVSWMYFDFKKQFDGTITYAESRNEYFTQMDESGKKIGEFSMLNGYVADFHDLILLPDVNRLMYSYPTLEMDLSGFFGDTAGTKNVTYCVIQELTNDDEVIFEWNSLDHLAPDEVTPQRIPLLLNNFTFDYIHVNSIEKDSDTSYIFSARNSDKLYRISKNTGEIIWSAGLGENSTMELISEVPGEVPEVSAQHDARIMPNGRLSVFDNSGITDGSKGRICEFEIDEENNTFTLVKVLRQKEDVVSLIMGNVQNFPDGAKVSGWGSGQPNVAEYDKDGNLLLTIELPAFNYRAFKFDFKNKAFTLDVDSIDFGEHWTGKEYAVKVNITNNLERDIRITEIHARNTDKFKAPDFNFIAIPSGETRPLWLTFDAEEGEEWEDILTIISDSELERYATQINVKGLYNPPSSVDNKPGLENVVMYPNPAVDNLNVRMSDNSEILSVRIQLLSGAEIDVFNDISGNRAKLNLEGLSPGIYFVIIETRSGIETRPVIISSR
jgi:hypothetical protein